ncbi:MAG: hypothetical protein MUF49_28105 [Oculatellaceae cyanobacterium Prado106]|jgi:hypothetical protein|nr:hypothetical protein [Oculatellaceae cyanobacterium Prado106]
MAASGTYTEALSSGGNLTITSRNWSIEYYFPGPDLRYKGTFVSVNERDVKDHIQAFQDNWAEYEQMRAMVPNGTEVEKKGQSGMVIRVGGYWPGVSLRSYHMPLSGRGQIDKVIADYRYALDRAPAIQKFLASI